MTILGLFNYLQPIKFLENPEKDWIKEEDLQLKISFNSA
jgi:hypothetical protein